MRAVPSPAASPIVAASEVGIVPPSSSGPALAALHGFVLLQLGATLGPVTETIGALLALACATFAIVAVRHQRHQQSTPATPPSPTVELTASRSLRVAYAGVAALAAATTLTRPFEIDPVAFRHGDDVIPLPASIFYWALRLFGVVALVLIGLHEDATPRRRARIVRLLLVVTAALWLAIPLAQPHPSIDVWQLHQHAAHALLRGEDPYTTHVPDIYAGRFFFGYSVDVYDYLPLNLLAVTPSVALFGDYRYALVLAALGSILLLRAAARRLVSDPRVTDLVTLAFLVAPNNGRVLTHGWTEPLLLVALAAFTWLQTRAPRSVLPSVALFLVPAIKQYFAVPLLLYGALLRPRLGAVLVGVAVATATIVPFVLWDPRAAIEYGVLFVVRRTPFRLDSASLPALLYPLTHVAAGKALSVATQLAAGLATGWALRDRGLAGLLLASATTLLATFVLGAQAFLNYYWFVGGVLLLAAMALAAHDSGSTATAVPANDDAVADDPGGGAARIGPGISRALLVGAAVFVVGGAVRFALFELDCWAGRRAAALAAGDHASPIPVDDYAITRPGDRVFACHSQHCVGSERFPLRCHEDLLCWCVPAEGPADAASLARELARRGRDRAVCPDEERPLCPPGHCSYHLMPTREPRPYGGRVGDARDPGPRAP